MCAPEHPVLEVLKKERNDLINARGKYRMMSEEEYDIELNSILYNIKCIEMSHDGDTEPPVHE